MKASYKKRRRSKGEPAPSSRIAFVYTACPECDRIVGNGRFKKEHCCFCGAKHIEPVEVGRE